MGFILLAPLNSCAINSLKSDTRSYMSHKITTHRPSARGFSEQLANEINRRQAAKTLQKMGAKKMHPSKPKQGYSPMRSGVDIKTL